MISTDTTDEALAEVMQTAEDTAVQAAFRELMERYERKMTRYANKFLYTYEDRQDAVQEVFIKVYKNIQSFRTSERFSPWIYRIAHNTFFNVIKKQKREKVAFFDADKFFTWGLADEHMAAEHEQKLDREALEQVLAKLDVKYREPLVLYYFEGKDYTEIAEILALPRSTVGVRLRRGREAMQKLYKKYNE